MAKKVRELKAMLKKAGFTSRPGKGSHTVWEHPKLRDHVTLSGNDGDDAKPYQEKQVKDAIKETKRK
jgi:predicted RNA binding protein YcfA (HicA-like mRNA interferase family)